MPGVGKQQGEPANGRKLVLKYWKVSELVLLGGMAVLGAVILLIHLLAWGLPLWREAHRYSRGQCVVEKRYVNRQVDEDGKESCRPEILIRFYDQYGRARMSHAYDRQNLTEDGGFYYDRKSAEDIILGFKIGEVYPCWYETANPGNVILKRDTSIWGWLFLSVTLALVMFGLAGLGWLARRRSVSRENLGRPINHNNRFPTVPASREINESPGTELAYRLPTVVSPVIQSVFGIVLAVLWNLVSVCFLAYAFSIGEDLLDMVIAVLFGLVFCGIGLVSLGWFCWRFWQIQLTGATLVEISDHPVTPNRKYRVALSQNGYLFARFYNINLVCEETARYRQGTDTLTNVKEVFSLPLFSKTDFLVPSGQTFREEFFMKVPMGAMHSFSTESNAVSWNIVVEIQTKKTGTVKRVCPIVVLPFSPGIPDTTD